MSERKKLPAELVRQVLTEAGYRCGVPTCRQILAIDLHHMVEVSDGGPNDATNLLALCPTCHALYHRGTISRESIFSWNATLVALSAAFDLASVDDLLFLEGLQPGELPVSGDGVLHFRRIIGAGLASFKLYLQNGPLVLYDVQLTERGKQLVSAWKTGQRAALSGEPAGGGARGERND